MKREKTLTIYCDESGDLAGYYGGAAGDKEGVIERSGVGKATKYRRVEP